MTFGDGLPEKTALLTSNDDVIRVLGGTKRVAILTKCSRSSVWNWRRAGQFPARHYRVLRDALRLRGCVADPALFAFTTGENLPVVDVAA